MRAYGCRALRAPPRPRPARGTLSGLSTMVTLARLRADRAAGCAWRGVAPSPSRVLPSRCRASGSSKVGATALAPGFLLESTASAEHEYAPRRRKAGASTLNLRFSY